MSIARRSKNAIVGLSVCAATIIGGHEGLKLLPYNDMGGVLTVCYGETEDVQHRQYTKDECRSKLQERVPDYMIPIDKAMPGLPDNRLVAYTDTAYNLGTGFINWQKTEPDPISPSHIRKVPGTSIVELERDGHWREACYRLLDFNKVKVGGVAMVVRGLTRRRESMVHLCLKGFES